MTNRKGISDYFEGKYYYTYSQCREKSSIKKLLKVEKKKLEWYPQDFTNIVRANEALITKVKAICPDLKCVDVSMSLPELEVYNTLATRIYTDKLNLLNYTTPFSLPIFPALFDWILLSYVHKKTGKEMNVLFGNIAMPRTIFVKTESLRVFTTKILPHIIHPFVLYTGSNDFTIPNNVDLRFDSTEKQSIYLPIWKEITSHKHLLHWYVENHDELHPKVSTMPIGLNPKEFHPDDRSEFIPEANLTQLWQRPLKILSIDRVRSGPQWASRADAHHQCARIPDICRPIFSELTHQKFIAAVSSFPFLLCVHGGGLGNYNSGIGLRSIFGTDQWDNSLN